MAADKVMVFDTTLRDGEQSAGIGLTTQEKLQVRLVARALQMQNKMGCKALSSSKSPGAF